ncbi:MAG: SIS domain-containing protein [Firmicutes bacterium]|nr:SIS domain-containing protein [Bacillota bacterium]
MINMRNLDINYKKNLEMVLKGYQEIVQKIKKVVSRDFKNINLVGCGANYSQMLTIKYIFAGLIKNINCNVYQAGEYDRKIPITIDENSLVIGMSHSGNTAEVYNSLKKSKDQKAKLLAISSNEESKIAQIADLHFQYPDGEQMSELKLLFLSIITFAVAEVMENPLPEELKEGLFELPELLEEAHQLYKDGALKFAEDYADKDMIYTIGSGPTMGAAFAFGNCKLMEMQWKDASVLNACNFFHGPLEVVDDNHYFLLFAAGDKQSDYVRRIEEYLEYKKANYYFVDALDVYSGNSSLVKEYLTPFLLWPALTIYAWALEEKTGHNLDIRRNMGKEGTGYIWE